jgi:hypothetical protein
MVKYPLDHLTQPEDQRVLGPIQDDEALLLFSIVRGMRLRRVLEIGGLSGYSAANFLAAGAALYTVDLNPVPVMGDQHRVIVKDALELTPEDLDGQPVDLVFFDCHDMVQMQMYKRFVERGIISEDTVLALHDTNLHYAPFNVWGPYVPQGGSGPGVSGGFAHQPVERHMVNEFKAMGYDIFSLHTGPEKHDASFPFRHGITICQRFRRLE